MYHYRLYDNQGHNIRSRAVKDLDACCEGIYDDVCLFLDDVRENESSSTENELSAIEASSWAELNQGTEDEPAVYETDYFMLEVWSD